ncbi:hypothetical protein ACIPVK_10565 [Paeniglutamicibacter sp. MACA_103]|uniref:hypothetical protein n=1 Tax=Paeniglutamicibacter sp. MACA_103 TaxID=3377337 RepID=UPI0038960D15
MKNSHEGKEREDHDSVPPTLDSFDPLRDAERLLEDDDPSNAGSEARGAVPGADPERAVGEEDEAGPADTNEDEARFDAG